jgi:hypothetical protein
MRVITPSEGLYCYYFTYSVLCLCGCPEIRTRSIDWAQLSNLLPEDCHRTHSPKRFVLIQKEGDE